MVEPVSTSVGVGALASSLFGYIHEIGLHVAGGEAHHKYQHFAEKLRHRLLVGGLPVNNHILHALHHSLAGATLVCAYSFHDPERRLIQELIRSKATWTRFQDFQALCHQIHESIKGKIIPENAWRGDAWLVQLIEQANEPKNFHDFGLASVLTENQTTALVRPRPDAELRHHIQEEFLRWASAHVLIPAPKPPGFEAAIRHGLALRDAHSGRLDFYEIFCLFFREELKEQTPVHRAFVNGVLAELKGDVDQIVSALPSAEEREKFQLAVEALGSFDEFKRTLERENREVLGQISSALASVERKFDYLVGGLRVQPFEPPDPPARELELLHAKQRAIDLVGRDSDLAALWRWLNEGENISARLLVGRAGSGKTRLAFELLLRVNRELPEWQAGLVTGSALRKFAETKEPSDFTWPAPTLLVVDYAQTLARPLTELFLALTHKRRADGLPPLRLLLLERQAGDWFGDLLRKEDGCSPCAIGKLFDPPAPVELTPLPPGQLRRQILEQTLARAARLEGLTPVVLPAAGDPDYQASLQRELFEQPLNLMLAALAASKLGLLPALTRSRIELAEVLAKRELARVERFVRDPQSDAQKSVLRQLAACATMERGFTGEELERAVEEELRALKITWPDGLGDLAKVLRQALPGDTMPVAQVEPDFVGEALVLEVLARPETPGGHERWRAWCAVVERCCRRDPNATPATLLHSFQNFGHQVKYGEPLLAATDALIRKGLADADPALLLGIENALPDQTVELRPRAAEVTRQLYNRLKAELNQGREELKPEVARLAGNLANRLSEIGRLTDALAPAREAVQFFRSLGLGNPGAFHPDLAGSLNNLANGLVKMGRRADALAPAQEAVELYRALARRDPETFQPDLAGALNNLANGLGKMGRRADALAPAQEAVELYRALARRDPEAFLTELAGSLNNLATFLSQAGRPADALAPAQEAVEFFRSLALGNPDACQPALAGSLSNLATFLSQLGREAEALVPAQEAVELRRALAGRNPDAFQPGLANSLNNLAILLSHVGRPADAFCPAQEAVKLYEALAQSNPEAFQPDLAMSLHNLANRLRETGRTAEALAPAQQSVEIHRALAQCNPDAFQPALARALGVFGRILEGNDRREAALAAFAEGVGALTRHFLELPAAHTPLMSSLAQEYLRLSQALGLEPDMALLAPVAEVFSSLKSAPPLIQ